MTGSDVPPSFTLGYVPGVTSTKWVRMWNERLPMVPLTLTRLAAGEAVAAVHDRGVDAVLLRLPIDRAGLHAIPLYTETTVVVVPKDHPLAEVDETTVGNIHDEVVLSPLDDTLSWERFPGRPAIERPASTEDAIQWVAAGVGLLVVPQSLARLYHRKDLTYRPVLDAPQSSVALSWLEDETTDLIEQFIGIVRGRTVNSTRGRPSAPAPVKSERRKPAASQRGKSPRRGSSGGKGGKPRRRS